MRRFPKVFKILFYVALACVCLFSGSMIYLRFFTPQWHAFAFAPGEQSWGLTQVGSYWSKADCISAINSQIKSGIQLSNGKKANGGKCGRHCNDDDMMFNFDGQSNADDLSCEESITF